MSGTAATILEIAHTPLTAFVGYGDTRGNFIVIDHRGFVLEQPIQMTLTTFEGGVSSSGGPPHTHTKNESK